VIDAENFVGYEDTSPTARMQASYTDLIVINKWEHVSERALDLLIDHLNTLNDQTPKIKCEGRNGIDPSLIFGLDSKLYLDSHNLGEADSLHHDEVETVTVYRGAAQEKLKAHHHDHEHHSNSDGSSCTCDHSSSAPASSDPPQDGASGPSEFVEESRLSDALSSLSKEAVWRVKGFVRIEKGLFILNWAFGRYDLTSGDKLDLSTHANLAKDVVKLTVMGERGEVKRAVRKFCVALGAELLQSRST